MPGSAAVCITLELTIIPSILKDLFYIVMTADCLGQTSLMSVLLPSTLKLQTRNPLYFHHFPHSIEDIF